jgi:hypothetical protein
LFIAVVGSVLVQLDVVMAGSVGSALRLGLLREFFSTFFEPLSGTFIYSSMPAQVLCWFSGQ